MQLTAIASFSQNTDLRVNSKTRIGFMARLSAISEPWQLTAWTDSQIWTATSRFCLSFHKFHFIKNYKYLGFYWLL